MEAQVNAAGKILGSRAGNRRATGAEDDRYAELASRPASSATTSEAAQTPAYDPQSSGEVRQPRPHRERPSRPDPAEAIGQPDRLADPASDACPRGNPLRDPGAATATGRPEAPPQPVHAPEPASPAPEKPPPPIAVAPPPAAEVGTDHPDQTRRDNRRTTAPPATPAAPAAEKKPEPKEHSCGVGQAGPADEQEQRRAVRSDQGERPDLRRLAQAQAGAGDHGQSGGLPGAVRMCGPGSHEGRNEPPLLALPPASRKRLAGRRHRRRRHRQGFRQTGRTEVPDRRQRHERDALQRRHARAVRPAPAHRRGHGPDHAGRRQQQDDVRLRQRRSVRLQRNAAAADAIDRGRLQDDRRHGGAGKDLHGATGRQRRSEDDRSREALERGRAPAEDAGQLSGPAGPHDPQGGDRSGQQVSRISIS